MWTRSYYTSALETVLISPPRATLVADDPDLVAAGLDPTGAWYGKTVREVPAEGGEEGGEEEAAETGAGVGIAVHRRTKLGGLGRLKDYSKRRAETPNPWAPPAVREGGREGGRKGQEGREGGRKACFKS